MNERERWREVGKKWKSCDHAKVEVWEKKFEREVSNFKKGKQ